MLEELNAPLVWPTSIMPTEEQFILAASKVIAQNHPTIYHVTTLSLLHHLLVLAKYTSY